MRRRPRAHAGACAPRRARRDGARGPGQRGTASGRRPAPPGLAAAAAKVYCVDWVPGTNRLRGVCPCGAVTEVDDPALMWEWLVGHRARH